MTAFKDWLHVEGGEAPMEYRDYVLRTQLYHCLPSDLDAEAAQVVDLDWQMFQAELQHKKSQDQTIG